MSFGNASTVILRAIVSLINSFCFDIGLTSPNPPPSPEEKAKYANIVVENYDKAPAKVKSRDTFPIPVWLMTSIAKASLLDCRSCIKV